MKLSKCSLDNDELEAVSAVLSSEYLGMGPVVRSFESQIGAFIGASAVCCSTGTNALELALRAQGVGIGDEVVIPNNTYVATACAVVAVGATPVTCDVDLVTLNMDVETISEAISDKTRAILCVHYAGVPCMMEKINDLAAQRGLIVIEDAAHAFGSRYDDGRLVGNSDNLVCFSFDGIKNITSGEGGCIVSKDTELLTSIMDDRLLGVVRDSDFRYARSRSLEFDVLKPGRRYHMSDINAAIGISQLNKLKIFHQKKFELWQFYHDELEILEGVRCVLPAPNYEVFPHIYPIVVTNQDLALEVIENFKRNKIPFGRNYPPISSLSAFKNTRPNDKVFSEIYPRLFTLPFHADLDHASAKRVVSALSSTVS